MAVARFALVLNEKSNADTRRVEEALSKLNELQAELTELIPVKDRSEAQRHRLAVLPGLAAHSAASVVQSSYCGPPLDSERRTAHRVIRAEKTTCEVNNVAARLPASRP